MVFNYDLPQEHEYYVHRIGRTGRNGKSGKAISFVVGKEIRELHDIEKYAKIKIKAGKAPTISQVEEIENVEIANEIRKIISKQKFANSPLVDTLVDDGYSFEQIAKALSTYISKDNMVEEKAPIKNGMVKLFLTVGKKDNIKIKDIVGAIASKTTVAGKDLGKIIVLDNYSFIEVPAEYVDEVVKTMNKNQIKNKNVKVEIAEN